jgi:hypothetical protein
VGTGQLVFLPRSPTVKDLTDGDYSRIFEVTYTHQQMHSAVGYQTPAAFEQQQLLCAETAQASTGLSGARELTAPSPQSPLSGSQPLAQDGCR